MPITFLVLGGGGGLGFFLKGGGGKCHFYICGRGDFSDRLYFTQKRSFALFCRLALALFCAHLRISASDRI